MKKKIISVIIGGFSGFVIGAAAGGYLGLVVGGTLLGSFDIYESTGFEGYELAMYAGAVIGALILTLLGIKFALKIAANTAAKKTEK